MSPFKCRTSMRTTPILFSSPSWYNPGGVDHLEVNVPLLRDFVELTTAQPGALVYHLVTLFAIQLIAGVAAGHWQRQRDVAATRLLVAGVGLFLARAIPMLVAVLHSVGALSSAVVLPPLERFLQLVSSTLVIWAFLPILERNPRLGSTLVLVVTLIAAGAYAAFASLWPGAVAEGVVYNDYWQAKVWDLSTAAILGLALVASLLWRASDWGWLVCLLALWFLGHVLQYAIPSPATHFAGWVRLVDLAALPLLAALFYRRALHAGAPAGEGSGDSPQGALGILYAIRHMETGGDLKSGLEIAARSTAQALDADMVAIVLLVRGATEMLRVYALHPTSGAMAAKGDLMPRLSDYPVLTKATGDRPRNRPTVDHRGNSQLKDLYQHLGFEESGPLMVQPIRREQAVLGLLLAGNPSSQRDWSSRDEQIVDAVARVLAPAIVDSSAR